MKIRALYGIATLDGDCTQTGHTARQGVIPNSKSGDTDGFRGTSPQIVFPYFRDFEVAANLAASAVRLAHLDDGRGAAPARAQSRRNLCSRQCFARTERTAGERVRVPLSKPGRSSARRTGRAKPNMPRYLRSPILKLIEIGKHLRILKF